MNTNKWVVSLSFCQTGKHEWQLSHLSMQQAASSYKEIAEYFNNTEVAWNISSEYVKVSRIPSKDKHINNISFVFHKTTARAIVWRMFRTAVHHKYCEPDIVRKLHLPSVVWSLENTNLVQTTKVYMSTSHL